jgi:hypothetical protein
MPVIKRIDKTRRQPRLGATQREQKGVGLGISEPGYRRSGGASFVLVCREPDIDREAAGKDVVGG